MSEKMNDGYEKERNCGEKGVNEGTQGKQGPTGRQVGKWAITSGHTLQISTCDDDDDDDEVCVSQTRPRPRPHTSNTTRHTRGQRKGSQRTETLVTLSLEKVAPGRESL